MMLFNEYCEILGIIKIDKETFKVNNTNYVKVEILSPLTYNQLFVLGIGFGQILEKKQVTNIPFIWES